MSPPVLVMPLPEQGHVIPLMELSHRLVEHGLEVTFVCTEHIHKLLLDGGATDEAALGGVRLVSVPDGLADSDDRRDLGKVLDGFTRSIPAHMAELIRVTKAEWLVADSTIVGWCSEVAKKLGVRVACFFPASAAYLGTLLRIPQLIEEGIFDANGFPKRQEALELAPNMPPLYPAQMPWSVAGGPEGQQAFFRLVSRNAEATRNADVVVCNTFLDAERTALGLYPEILPIGPLLSRKKKSPVAGQFLPEDTGCLEWLDAHSDKSVVYVAFGTSSAFDPGEIRALAEGLERTGRPFLWVVRPDFTAAAGSGGGVWTKEWFDGFKERVAGKAMVVSWCAQQQVLAHPAVACFVTHCGWNSTMEAVMNGVPILCWPYFLDHFTHQSYICDIWRTGLAVSPGQDGVGVTKEEVSSKVEQMVTDIGIAQRARSLSDAAHRGLAPGGSSFQNFNTFLKLLGLKERPAAF
uniref:Uncharacterized protein n=1 Tax=Avena sativa TaxID=4498 RepID=A0ACD5X7G8_AVESA